MGVSGGFMEFQDVSRRLLRTFRGISIGFRTFQREFSERLQRRSRGFQWVPVFFRVACRSVSLAFQGATI